MIYLYVIVANDSSFLIYANNGTLEDVKNHIYLNPAVDLIIDLSDYSSNHGVIDIALPNSLRLNSNFSDVDGLYLNKNNNDNISISFTKNFTGRIIHVPLYVILDGNYEIESVVCNNEGYYYTSNSINVNIFL